MIHIASPEIGPEEIKAVNKVLQSGMLAQGPVTAELEQAFAEYCGTKYAVAVSSGTAAIHTALYVAGIGAGDEVITTPFSFIATANPIIFLGAKPVFVDIDSKTFNIDTTKIEEAITDKTKVIMPVHLYGQIGNMDEIKEIAKKHDLKIIEDACQAIGATYKEQKAGGLGDLGCFSLYATKNIMSGEGGMITTNNEDYAIKAKQFRQHGMSGPYQYEGIGYNYRMTDLQSAIAKEQVKKANKFNQARQNTAKIFDQGLAELTGIEKPVVGEGNEHVYHQYTIRITEDCKLSRDQFLEELRKRGVGAGVYYPKSLHTIPHIASFGYKNGDFPESELATSQVLSLPVHPKVSEKGAIYIVDTLKEILGA